MNNESTNDSENADVAFTRGDRCADRRRNCRRNGCADDRFFVHTGRSLLRRSEQRSVECSHEAIVVETVVPTVAPIIASTHCDLSIKK